MLLLLLFPEQRKRLRMSSRIESNLFGEERGFLLSFKGWWWLSSSSDFGDSDEVFETRCRELFLAVSFEKRRFFRRRRRFLLVGTLCHHRENKARWQQRERELETYRFYSPCVALLLFKFFCKNCMYFHQTTTTKTVHVDGRGPVGMQRRSRGLLGVSASQKRVSTRERDPSGSRQTTRGRSDEDMGQDRETRQRYELGRGEERRRRREGVVESTQK